MPLTSERNVAAFFVARMNSTRLPRKVLLEIQGKPLIVHQIERVRLCKSVNQFILCTTINPLDDELEGVAREAGLDVFRGSESDVPGRLLSAAEQFGVDFFLLVEADDHFVDPGHLDALVAHWKECGDDFIRVDGTPIGAWARGISRRAMEKLCRERDTDGLDGWGAWFEQQDDLQCTRVNLMEGEDHELVEKVRLTIDYPEDFELAEALYARLYTPGNPLRIHDVLAQLQRDPNLIDINLHRQDAYLENLREKSGGIVR